MADETKVYCYDRPASDNSALWGALMSRNNESPAELMSLMNNCNMNNNPFIWLVFLMLFRNGLWNGGDGVGENYNSRQISALQDTVNSNHNNAIALEAIRGNGGAISQLASTFNTDFNTISTAICGVKSAIEKVGGDVNYSSERVINAINLGDANLMSKMQDCCCQNKELVQRMGYENQLAQKDTLNAIGTQTYTLNERLTGIANGLQKGFSDLGYIAAQNKGEIINAIKSEGQTTRDLLNQHWKDELSQALQDEKFKNSQLQQNIYFRDLVEKKGCGCNC